MSSKQLARLAVVLDAMAELLDSPASGLARVAKYEQEASSLIDAVGLRGVVTPEDSAAYPVFGRKVVGTNENGIPTLYECRLSDDLGCSHSAWLLPHDVLMPSDRPEAQRVVLLYKDAVKGWRSKLREVMAKMPTADNPVFDIDDHDLNILKYLRRTGTAQAQEDIAADISMDRKAVGVRLKQLRMQGLTAKVTKGEVITDRALAWLDKNAPQTPPKRPT